MQCENAYTKPGVRGILCRKCEEPKAGDMRSMAHALCGHQRFCPNQRCYTLLPGWEECTMRENKTKCDANSAALDRTDSREEGAGEEIAPKKARRTAKKKSAEKAADGE